MTLASSVNEPGSPPHRRSQVSRCCLQFHDQLSPHALLLGQNTAQGLVVGPSLDCVAHDLRQDIGCDAHADACH
jgi:hypothetical protein